VENENEIAALYRQHFGAARAFAIAVTRDPALAEDIAQESFIRAASRLGRLRDPEKFRSYLLRTVVHTSSSHFRRRGAEQRSLDRFAANRGVEDHELAPTGLAADLVEALGKLPPRQRTAIAARFLFDWSEAETARAMGCRAGTVKSLTSRGLAALRVAMADKEDVDHA
jgi:RNA polymerase sigma factor (sigma-70 family)